MDVTIPRANAGGAWVITVKYGVSARVILPENTFSHSILAKSATCKRSVSALTNCAASKSLLHFGQGFQGTMDSGFGAASPSTQMYLLGGVRGTNCVPWHSGQTAAMAGGTTAGMGVSP